jgi:deoxyribodipyrimidine photolyase-related protein
MKSLILVLGDQLTHDLSAFDGANASRDVVLMAEVAEETTYVPHHKQKIALILSAMRHFADELREKGYGVDYIELDDAANSGSFTGEIERAIRRHKPGRIVTTWPGEWRVLEMMRGWSETFGLPVDIREDDRFLCSRAEFSRWAQDRKSLRMEFFYREMRRATGLLMDGDQPLGGQWNFDAENRKAIPRDHRPPLRRRFAPDAITRDVLKLAEARFASHFGTLDTFGWPVTREEALQALDHFIRDCLPSFGDFQDAMQVGNSFLYHSLISSSLNLGLLKPMEICQRAEAALQRGKAPLNAVEGFVRQILGWREYVRGLYWLRMPHYAQTNALDAKRPLPSFYWSGETGMACMKDTVETTRDNAYAHHIQRLMITGNFALLAGIKPSEIEGWYLAVYIDAFDWVELPNTHGMAIFADGGVMASKPYAASGAYINRMSNYCGNCRYDVKLRNSEGACPFNYLYWNFLMENEGRLSRNPRMAMPYKNLARLPDAERKAISRQARNFLEKGEKVSARPKAKQATLGL